MTLRSLSRRAGQWLSWALVVAAISTLAGDEVVQVELAPAADTTLFGEITDQNLGGTDTLIAGGSAIGATSRALVRFDFAGRVPADAAVLGASLRLTVLNANPMANPATFNLHRLLRPWGEGVKTGGRGMSATAGEATWNARFHPDETWSRPGAAAPEDFEEVSTGRVPVVALGELEFPATASLIGDVQLWVDDPGSNFGWILVNENEASPMSTRRMGSREHAASPPKLVLQYKLLTPEPRIGGISASNGTVRLQLELRHRREHSLEFQDSLEDSAWVEIARFPSSPVFRAFEFSALIAPDSRRFYRLVLLP